MPVTSTRSGALPSIEQVLKSEEEEIKLSERISPLSARKAWTLLVRKPAGAVVDETRMALSRPKPAGVLMFPVAEGRVNCPLETVTEYLAKTPSQARRLCSRRCASLIRATTLESVEQTPLSTKGYRAVLAAIKVSAIRRP